LQEVSVETILKRAKVSRATFYFYYRSKYAVLAALFRGVLDDVQDVFTATWASRDPSAPEEGLRDALRASYGLFVTHAPVLRAAADHAVVEPAVGESFRAMIGRLIDSASVQIDRDRELGVAPVGLDSKQLATSLIWMNERVFYLTSLGPAHSGHPDADAMVDSLAAVWSGAVYGRHPAWSRTGLPGEARPR
jgi:AcrR family transcriptional regulator